MGEGEGQDRFGGPYGDLHVYVIQGIVAVANIHYAVLEELVEMENFRKKPHLILSGLMRSQGRDIKKRLERFGLKILQEWDGGGDVDDHAGRRRKRGKTGMMEEGSRA